MLMPLHHKDTVCHHQIIIFVKVVYDAALCYAPHNNLSPNIHPVFVKFVTKSKFINFKQQDTTFF